MLSILVNVLARLSNHIFDHSQQCGCLYGINFVHNSLSKSGGRVSKTSRLRYPHKKKSHAVRSRDLAGQGMSPK
jgi:hypothetical protein